MDQRDEIKPGVLVIDDSIDVHRLLSARLRGEPIELSMAVSGEEGLRRAEETRPAVVLLDLDMPGMDGFEVLRELKDRPATRDTPVIVLSGLNSSQDKVTAFDLGAQDYVTKPFDLTELRVRLRAALRLSRLLGMLAQHAQVDGLTGLWNRRYFDTRWAEEIAGATRHNRPLSIAILDLDHFKSINDMFGHPAGDAVLEGFAGLLREERRATDIACRFGGEEFSLIMPDTAPRDAAVVCDRLRTKLETLKWTRHPERAVTVSVGIAGSDGAAAVTAGAWLEAADKNLYEAKRSGRNRVVATSVTGVAVRLAEAG